MSFEIKPEDLSEEVIDGFFTQISRDEPRRALAAFLNLAIQHGLVSPPVHSTVLERLKSMAAQHACGCGHPACKRCADDRLNKDAIEGASK